MSRTQLPARRFGPFEDFSTDMERVFDSVLGRTFGTMLRNGATEKFLPTLDLAETVEGFEIDVDLPGVKAEDVKLELHDSQLIISGKRERVSDRKDKNFHYVERSSGSFVRTVVLPSEVDSDKIEAHYENGMLHIKLPKSAKSQPKKIEIRSK